MTFGESIPTCFRKVVDFKGRATRSECWWFFLFAFGVSFAISSTAEFFDNRSLEIFGILCSYALVLPSLSVGVRRIHDTGHHWWFILIPFYNLILCCQPSDGPNQFDEVA